MDDTNSLIEQRRAKLAALRDKGIDPFKNKFTPGETCADARKYYAEGRETAVAGRITAHREMGKSMFIDVRDQSGRLQIYAQKNALGDELWEIFKHLDLGDFVGVRGKMFTTKTGEISVKLGGVGVPSVGQASRLSQTEKEKSETAATAVLPPFVILAKALRPPPEKWHGIEDTEIRYRQRYLDLMASKPGTSRTGFEPGSSGDVLLLRSEIIREIRNFLHARGFVEVETPMMQAIPGGAAAQPFKTHHNALGCDFYLRIALELYLKRLLVGGVDKVFEIGRNFRNEGLSRKHNPEFTMLEAYQAFGDYESMMELVQSMICDVAQKVLGTLVIHRNADSLRNAVQELKAAIPRDKAVALLLENFERQIGKFSTAETASDLTVFLAQNAPELEGYLKQHKFGGLGLSLNLDWFRNKFSKFAETSASIDLNKWEKRRYKDLIREKAGADWFEISPEARRQRAHDLGAEITKDYQDFEVTGAVFEKLIEPTLIQPMFVTHLPKELV
ncbi:MAG: amino acid--tRNA ligase-related protein, partial [Verrucomicrobiota bacterium]